MSAIDFVMQPQPDNSQWCWAAVAVSVSQFYADKKAWTQCDLVNEVEGQQTCCANQSSEVCDVPEDLDVALRKVGHMNGTINEGTFPFDACAMEIEAGQPICVRIGWIDDSGELDGTGHFCAITGIGTDQDQLLTVQDPDAQYGTSPTQVPYSAFASSYHGGKWTHYYLTQ